MDVAEDRTRFWGVFHPEVPANGKLLATPAGVVSRRKARIYDGVANVASRQVATTMLARDELPRASRKDSLAANF